MDEEPIWEVDEYGDEFLAVERMAPKCGSVRSAEAIHAEAEQLVFVRPSDVGADERALLGQLMRTTKLLQEDKDTGRLTAESAQWLQLEQSVFELEKQAAERQDKAASRVSR